MNEGEFTQMWEVTTDEVGYEHFERHLQIRSQTRQKVSTVIHGIWDVTNNTDLKNFEIPDIVLNKAEAIGNFELA